ncbi:MAG: cupredoxin domain-containing protein [Bradymonadaceae bacterium]
MKRSALFVLAVVASVGLVCSTTACSGKQKKKDEKPTAEESADKKEEKQKQKKVVLYQYRFNPNSLTVQQGTKVKFLNKDQEKHNVKIAALDLDKNLEPGEEFTHTFETSGEFAVENRLSEEQMKMTIVVEK